MRYDKQQKEIWKDIIGYEGYYKINNKGTVISLDRITAYSNGAQHNHKGRIMATTKCPKGYIFVSLSMHGKTIKIGVHRLVAKSFIPNPLNKPQINHIDSVPSNNNVENLEWVTAKENTAHAMEFGKKNSILQKDIPVVIELYKNGKSATQIGNIYKITYGAIIRILKINNISIRSASEESLNRSVYNKQNVILLYNLGLTTRKIEELTNVPRSTVSAILRRNNVNIRNKSEASAFSREIKHILNMPNEKILRIVKN